MSPINKTIDVIKQLPSVTLHNTSTDSSQTTPNKSDLSLRGDHNTVTVSPSSYMEQKKQHTSNLAVLLVILINLIGMSVMSYMHYTTTETFRVERVHEHASILTSAKQYTDVIVKDTLVECEAVYSEKAAAALERAIMIAQDGNRNIIRIQLIREYDEFLIDGKTVIKRRDLDGLRDMYDYYMSIGGNHDVPPRQFQFEQYIAKKLIVVED